MASNHSAHDTAHHLIPLPTYYKIFGALIVMTVITVLAAQVDFGALNAVVAFGIATVKAVLVAGWFMHLKYDDKLNRVILLSGVFFLIVLWFFCIMDESTRNAVTSTL